jgi:hypothetical protein
MEPLLHDAVLLMLKVRLQESVEVANWYDAPWKLTAHGVIRVFKRLRKEPVLHDAVLLMFRVRFLEC